MAMSKDGWMRRWRRYAPVRPLRSGSVEKKSSADGQRERKREGKRERLERRDGVPPPCWY
jgi:hypothetical protein